MKSKTKAWLIIAVAFIFGGILLAGIGAAMGGTFKGSFFFRNGHLNFSKGSDEYVSETKTVSDFEKLKLVSGVVDVNIVKGSDKFSISYYVPEKYIPKIDEGKTLNIEVPSDNGLFFNFFDFDSENPYITINIPSDDEFDFDIESSTGDIHIENINFEGDVEASTGDIYIKEGKLDDVQIKTSTGDIHFEGFKASEFKTTTSTGEMFVKDCNIRKLTSKTSTGDIRIDGSEFDSIKVDGSTSDVIIKSTKVEDINIDVSTGECRLGLKGDASDYSCKLTTSTGDITYDNDTFEKKYTHNGNGKGDITIHTSTGDISVSFD